jgi:hypothetical protein
MPSPLLIQTKLQLAVMILLQDQAPDRAAAPQAPARQQAAKEL